MLDLSKLDPGTWGLLAITATLLGNIILTLLNKRTPSTDSSATTQQAFYGKVMDENQNLRDERDELNKEMDDEREAKRLLREQLATVTGQRDKAIAENGDLKQILQGKDREIAQKDREITMLLRKNAGLNGHDKEKER